MLHSLTAPQRGRVRFRFVEGVDLAEGAETAFQVVDYGSGEKGFRVVGGAAGAPVDVMIYGGFFGGGVCEVRFLGRGQYLTMFCKGRAYLCVPEMCCCVVAEVAELEGDNFAHRYGFHL